MSDTKNMNKQKQAQDLNKLESDGTNQPKRYLDRSSDSSDSIRKVLSDNPKIGINIQIIFPDKN